MLRDTRPTGHRQIDASAMQQGGQVLSAGALCLREGLTPQDWERNRRRLRRQRSPRAASLERVMESFLRTVDNVNGIRAGDIVVDGSDAVPCAPERGVPLDGLALRTANLSAAASKAASILMRAAQESRAILQLAIDENREGWRVCELGVDRR